MHKRNFFLLVLLGLAMGCGQVKQWLGLEEAPPPTPKSAAEIWAMRVDEIQVGMPREEVKALLPPYNLAPTKRNIKGDTQVITYWLDEQWKVSIEYDFTGVSKEQRAAKSYDSPQNKVVSVPSLKKHAL